MSLAFRATVSADTGVFRPARPRGGKQASQSDGGGYEEQRLESSVLREKHAQKRPDCRAEGDGQHIVAHALAFAVVRHESRDDGADGGRTRAERDAVQQAQREQQP